MKNVKCFQIYGSYYVAPSSHGFKEKEDAAFIVRAVNSHDELIEVVTAMANFDGRNNNVALKEMALKALAKAK